jgi:CxxC motif-containing protein
VAFAAKFHKIKSLSNAGLEKVSVAAKTPTQKKALMKLLKILKTANNFKMKAPTKFATK